MTVVLRQKKPQFIASLKKHLYQLYPLHSEDGHNLTNTVHIHFPEMFNGSEYIPYTVLLTLLFLYVYYSFNKIDLVNSKFGIALTAVITVLGSLFMSLGLTGLRFVVLFSAAYIFPSRFFTSCYLQPRQRWLRLSCPLPRGSLGRLTSLIGATSIFAYF